MFCFVFLKDKRSVNKWTLIISFDSSDHSQGLQWCVLNGLPDIIQSGSSQNPPCSTRSRGENLALVEQRDDKARPIRPAPVGMAKAGASQRWHEEIMFSYRNQFSYLQATRAAHVQLCWVQFFNLNLQLSWMEMTQQPWRPERLQCTAAGQACMVFSSIKIPLPVLHLKCFNSSLFACHTLDGMCPGRIWWVEDGYGEIVTVAKCIPTTCRRWWAVFIGTQLCWQNQLFGTNVLIIMLSQVRVVPNVQDTIIIFIAFVIWPLAEDPAVVPRCWLPHDCRRWSSKVHDCRVSRGNRM